MIILYAYELGAGLLLNINLHVKLWDVYYWSRNRRQ